MKRTGVAKYQDMETSLARRIGCIHRCGFTRSFLELTRDPFVIRTGPDGSTHRTGCGSTGRCLNAALRPQNTAELLA